MEKVYSLLAAAAITMAANAQTLTMRSDLKTDVKRQVVTEKTINNEVKFQKALRSNVENKLESVSKAAAAETPADLSDLAGDYTITIGDFYFESSVGRFVEDATVTVSGNVAVISCDYFVVPVYATYDATTGKLTFEREYVGTTKDNAGNTYYVCYEPTSWNNTASKIDFVSYDATFDGSKIVFPADHGFSWVAYTDQECTVAYSYLDLFDVEGLEKVVDDPNVDPNEGWSYVGMATFQDGWMLPAVGWDQTLDKNKYAVELQQSEDNKNVYRLVDPYKGNAPVSVINESKKTGYIQFDVTDPEHVVFDKVDAGFANSTLGVTSLYCMNTLSFFAGKYSSLTLATIIETLGETFPFTTFKDGVVTVPTTIVTGEDGTTTYSNDACFGLQDNPYGGYSWTDENNAPVNMETKIYFPGIDSTGIENIAADEVEGETVYYNMQGMQIANPAKGQVVIAVKGNKATKVVF